MSLVNLVLTQKLLPLPQVVSVRHRKFVVERTRNTFCCQAAKKKMYSVSDSINSFIKIIQCGNITVNSMKIISTEVLNYITLACFGHILFMRMRLPNEPIIVTDVRGEI